MQTLNLNPMKKLVMIALMVLTISMSVNAKKIDKRIFVELTKTMLVVRPMETVTHQNVTVSYWKINGGGFYYIREVQEFRGKYKSYNFAVTCNKTTILGVKKHKRHVKKDLIRDIRSSRYL